MILVVAKSLSIRSTLVEMMEESAVKYLTEEKAVPKTEYMRIGKKEIHHFLLHCIFSGQRKRKARNEIEIGNSSVGVLSAWPLWGEVRYLG